MADIHRTYDATLTVLLACNEMKDNENGENQKIKRKKDMLSTTQSFFVVKLINVQLFILTIFYVHTCLNIHSCCIPVGCRFCSSKNNV